jgi:hypothetical protein
MPQPRTTTNPDLVVLTLGRLQEVVDEMVERGRLTRADAADLVSGLLARGGAQADERPGPEFPIAGYDDLTAAQVAAGLDGMSVADLRKVREYEKANANRKTVLAAIERRLA